MPDTPNLLEVPVVMPSAPIKWQAGSSALGNDNLLSQFEAFIGPMAYVFTLWALSQFFEGVIKPQYLVLSLVTFAISFPGTARLQGSVASLAGESIVNWAWTASLLLLLGWVTGYINAFPEPVLYTWLWLAPLSKFGAAIAIRGMAPTLHSWHGPAQPALIVGMNEQGLALANSITASVYSRIKLVGFVDNRSPDRLDTKSGYKLLGKHEQLAQIVQDHSVKLIYLSLPMASQPRILHVLDELKDTTASIYFVPDMFVTDLIQGHAGSVFGTPVISVCETPFKASNGTVKRISDVVFSLVILLLIFPALLVIALAVKLTSSGPIIFKQRRYGLDGEEILVYKFRSMTVTEDGGSIQQAQKNDARITPLGAFLRRTSLDELPQFINVLQGRMSIVGPRPHAVAHNELYRKLIKGYMVRHKVKPGITGWAQVNGYRGETDTLDKMQGRIDYDLDYLRNWSLQLDIDIILKTIRLVVKDQKAY
jgi:putative colanic acid biosysnthesis UDP-glucose lipid carrier transferase